MCRVIVGQFIKIKAQRIRFFFIFIKPPDIISGLTESLSEASLSAVKQRDHGCIYQESQSAILV